MKLGVFDIIGPIMIGPSSSHTAGAVRIGLLARAILGSEPKRVDILLHGSFAQTYRGHGTDVALVAGLMGMKTDDDRIAQALDIAKGRNLEVNFAAADLGLLHPNTAKLIMQDAFGAVRTVIGSSIGGGSVLVSQIDDFSVELTGEFFTTCVLYQDRTGMVAKVSALLAEGQVNIAQMKVSREDKGAKALMVVETDNAVQPGILAKMEQLSSITKVLKIQPIE